jgi:DNA-binding transcriptional LysR family regulator
MTNENVELQRPLDLDAVQAFVLVADLNSFTRAAEALATTQSAVSLKLKRLEDRLGRRLLERTPRRVRLSSEGAEFLEAARELLGAHERALNGRPATRLSLRIGISDQAAGAELPALLAKVGAYDRSLRIEVRIGPSYGLIGAYDRGEIDAAIVCRDSSRADGERLFNEAYAWFAVPEWEWLPNEPALCRARHGAQDPGRCRRRLDRSVHGRRTTSRGRCRFRRASGGTAASTHMPFQHHRCG